MKAWMSAQSTVGMALILLPTVACSDPLATTVPAVEPTRPLDPAQAYAIYSALPSGGSGAILVSTRLYEFDSAEVPVFAREGLPGIGEATWKSLQASREHPSQLEDRFDLQRQVGLIESTESERILGEAAIGPV
jgi:hypothetical protein